MPNAHLRFSSCFHISCELQHHPFVPSVNTYPSAMNLDHIKSESLRQLDLKHGPLSNLEDLNEYGLSSPPSSDTGDAVPSNISAQNKSKRLRKRSNSASSSRRSTLSKSQAPIIPTMEVLHSVDEDIDSNSNFQSSSSSNDADSFSERELTPNCPSAEPPAPLTGLAAELAAKEGDDGLVLFRQYSKRQRMKRRRSRMKGRKSGSAGTLGVSHRSEPEDSGHSTSSMEDSAPPVLYRSATMKVGMGMRMKSKKRKSTKSQSKTPTVGATVRATPTITEEKEGGLKIPGSTHLHHRSFSESALSRTITDGQWPSTCSEEEDDVDIYDRFQSMKRKYQRQRAISKQFQEAITVIQDDNEEHLVRNEQHIRDSLEQRYEMKLMQLEQQKLGSNLQTEIKMKTLQQQNEELLQQNKQLQHQLAAQVLSTFCLQSICILDIH